MKVKYASTKPQMENYVRSTIEELASSRTLQFQLVQRAEVIHLLDQGLRINQIAELVHLHRNKVTKWRQRFNQNLDEINALAKEEEFKKCRELIIQTLSDQPRSGRPKKFSQEEVDCVTATACSQPSQLDPEWPLSQWSGRTLSMFVVEKGLVSDISKSTVNRILKENQLRPHKQQMWIHSPEKYSDYENFIKKVREISTLITQTQDLYAKGIQIISIDEKPGISALTPLREDLPMRKGLVSKREMFYKRNGLQDLIQGINVATGDLFSPYVSDHHKEVDFLKALKACLKEQFEITPDDEIVVLCDNLSTHKSESLVRLVADLLGIDSSTLGMKNVYGILENMNSREEFLTDPSHRIRFVYTPKHTSWLNPVETYFSILNRDLLKRGAFKSTSEIREKIKTYSKWYNEHSARSFDYRFIGLEDKITKWTSQSQQTTSA